MTPNDMLEHLQGFGFVCDITSTGGNCGAITVAVPCGELLLTTESGPWATPDDDDHDRAEGWTMSWHDDPDGGTWVDGDLVRDGDAVFPESRVPVALARLMGYASR